MKNDDLNSIWADIEQQDSKTQLYQRMVYIGLLYRVYIGSSGIPKKRFLSIEIPETEINSFDNFTVPQGFTLNISKPAVRHAGYASCVLQAASSDLNDVFAIVSKDILESLKKQKKAETYIDTLKKRIEKWRVFFKNPIKRRLSEKAVIGLFGELAFIQNMVEAQIQNVADVWNGPINAAQDFQWDSVAAEVKTVATNKMGYVHISSEEQLDDDGRQELFLVAYRLERNDANGITLPKMIHNISELLSEQQKSRFMANLTCLGYADQDAAAYNNGYTIKECKAYRIKEGFPRILRSNLPQGVMETSYKLALQSCGKYEVEFDEISQAVREYEDGEN